MSLLQRLKAKSKWYTGWELDNGRDRMGSFSWKDVEGYVDEIVKRTTEFVILVPEVPIAGTNFMQTCMDEEHENYHLEICFGREHGYVIYGMDDVSATQVKAYLKQYLEERLVPDTEGWDLICEKDSVGQPELFVQIGRKISREDPAVTAELTLCVHDPVGYFEAHREQYEAHSIETAEDLDILRWIGLVDILEQCGYACDRDYRDTLEQFVYFVGQLHQMQRAELTIEISGLDTQESIPQWCVALDEAWAEKGYQMAVLDMDSDSYVLFPCPIAEYRELADLAARIGHRIMLAKEA